ncbi:hypothetical protein L1987_72280 [Smallanthus sonchifolius]|uniref:Uncharacterized protein n=1 Tax=Smallanthus sonchifolius TaxID=185202 RepID=A0ACB9AVM1_9ASTR|nr:hypothetical protein L1987_72280 [Smallanthus sonchifolius]
MKVREEAGDNSEGMLLMEMRRKNEGLKSSVESININSFAVESNNKIPHTHNILRHEVTKLFGGCKADATAVLCLQNNITMSKVIKSSRITLNTSFCKCTNDVSNPLVLDEDVSIATTEGDRISSLPDDLIHKILSSFDIRDVIKTGEITAQKIMAELGVILEKEEDNTKADLERGKANVAESHKPKKLKIGGSMEQMNSCWENLGVQVERGREKACLIISKLQCMEKLLTRLPTIQPCFNSLYAEADIAISKITDCIKIQCDENQSRSSVFFHELATTLEPSS